MSEEEVQKWFEAVWTQREEVVYRQLFGDIGSAIHTIPAALFERMGFKEVDPRWLVHGVFECKPVEGRANWVYVTSALSNPWGQTPEGVDRQGPSGLGFELMLQTGERAPWAISTLQWLMAVQILVASELVKGELLDYFDRVPLQGPVDPQRPGTVIRNLLIAEPEGLPKYFELDSGLVQLLLCVGVSDKELDFARTQGGPEMVGVLKHWGAFPVTDPVRGSVI